MCPRSNCLPCRPDGRDPARLLGHRDVSPAGSAGDGHPLNGSTQELYTHASVRGIGVAIAKRRGCRRPILQAAVSRRRVLPTRLAEVLHRRTEGNPLFVVSAIERLGEARRDAAGQTRAGYYRAKWKSSGERCRECVVTGGPAARAVATRRTTACWKRLV